MRRFDEHGFFHICTDGKAIPWIFQDDEDFIAGVNRIGICSIITGVDTVAYVLMDNHGHFIMYGSISIFLKRKKVFGNHYGLKQYVKFCQKNCCTSWCLRTNMTLKLHFCKVFQQN